MYKFINLSNHFVNIRLLYIIINVRDVAIYRSRNVSEHKFGILKNDPLAPSAERLE